MAIILTADIGGTNCRLAIFRHHKGTLSRERTVWLSTGKIHSAAALLDAMERELDTPTATADAVILAVAGPVLDPLFGATTNASLRLDLREVQARLPLGKAQLVNDFTAQAYACLTSAGAGARQIFPPLAQIPPASPDAPRGILGAGTGCGTASLVKDSAGQWLAIPSESGHCAFPFLGREEAEFARFAMHETGMALLRPDDVITGRGLSLLYLFLEGERLPAADVATRALHSDTPTLRWYARWYGRICRDWMLTTLCRGGLYIAGGIAARNPPVVDCPSFAEALYSSSHHAALLSSIPVRLVTDEHAGLWGAAWIGAQLGRRAAQI